MVKTSFWWLGSSCAVLGGLVVVGCVLEPAEQQDLLAEQVGQKSLAISGAEQTTAGPSHLMDELGYDPQPVPGSQVIGGSNASLGDYPWQVSMGELGDATLLKEEVYPHLCGGAVISNNHVLTAAHCVFGSDPAKIILRFGDIQRSDVPDQYVQFRGVENVIIHPAYTNSNAWRDGDDIAILELNEPLEYSTAVRPIAMGSVDPSIGEVGTVSGWGRTDGSMALGSDILQFAQLPVRDSDDCNDEFTFTTDPVNAKMLCVGHVDAATASCNGDSGGPLAHRASATAPYELDGIVSWGLTGCISYSVFTRVAYYESWVRSQAPEAYENGDVDNDGCVDDDDISAVLAALGQPASAHPVLMDQNMDGTIGTADYFAVLSNYDPSCP